MWPKFVDYLNQNLFLLVRVGLIFIGTLLLAKIVSVLIVGNMRLISKKLGRRLTIKHITRIKLIKRLLIGLIYFIGIAAILYQFESARRLGAMMFASASILGIIVAIAAQTSLANIFGGILISLIQPIRLGDFIEIEGQKGIVEEITLTSVYIKTLDNRRLIVPNKKIIDSPIINYSIISPEILIQIELTLKNPFDFNHWRPLIIKRVKRNKYLVPEKEPEIYLVDFDSEKIKIAILAWIVNPAKMEEAISQIKEDAYKFFKKEKLL